MDREPREPILSVRGTSRNQNILDGNRRNRFGLEGTCLYGYLGRKMGRAPREPILSVNGTCGNRNTLVGTERTVVRDRTLLIQVLGLKEGQGTDRTYNCK